MLFNSYAFLFCFLPVTLLIFYWLRATGRASASVPFLMVASLAFYAYWKPSDTFILIGLILFNFVLSGFLATSRGSRGKWLLLLGVCTNLGILFWFKYFEFVAANLAALGGWQHHPSGIVMPIGISFFTFTQLAYLVDCYRSHESERTFSNYGLFVTVFPHLIAGPIIHHAQMRPQFARLRTDAIDPNLVGVGVMVFIVGLAKKVLLADNLVSWADPAFNAVDHGTLISAAQAWVGITAYTLQIYFDFSGYSDMAIGLALLFGLRLPVNFDSPYKSHSFIEFWRRWHITLSTWLRDYLYISLGGNRGGEFMRLRNVMLTMLLGGIWHGAGWTFVIWGAIHGTCIVINHLLRKRYPLAKDHVDAPLTGAFKQAATLLMVMVAWAFFRAKTAGGALLLVKTLFAGGAAATTVPALSVLGAGWLLVGTAMVLFAPNTQQIFGYRSDITKPLTMPQFGGVLKSLPAMAIAFGVIFACVLACIWRPAIFIYFNF